MLNLGHFHTVYLPCAWVNECELKRRMEDFYDRGYPIDLINQLRFVLSISSHVNILLGSLSIIILFAFMAQLCMAQTMSKKSKEVLSGD